MAAVHSDVRHLAVLGMGSALPGPAVTTAHLLAHVDSAFGLKLKSRGAAVARRLGVRSRHLARELRSRRESPRIGDRNADLAARAVAAALIDAKRTVADIAYLIAHTATPGSLLPPGVAQVAQLLGYDGPFVELRQACTGFANALIFAASLCSGSDNGGGRSVAVIVGSETGSVYFDPLRAAQDDSQLVNMLQMGDGAGAIVLGTPTANIAPHIAWHYFGQLGGARSSAFRLHAGGSDGLDGTDAQPEFEHDYAAIRRDGELLFHAGVAAAAGHGVTPGAVDWIIPHQANGRMGEWLATALGVPRERVFINADRVGNTGSAAIWLALAELRGKLQAGSRVLVLGAEATKFMYGGFLYVHG